LVATHFGSDGKPLYHVVALQPEGYIITAADTELEPIIAFSESGQFDPQPDNPLRALLENDLTARSRQGSRPQGMQPASLSPPAMKWAELVQQASSRTVRLMGNGRDALDDLRVAPFIQSQWYSAARYSLK
jgi:hypothetical protein